MSRSINPRTAKMKPPRAKKAKKPHQQSSSVPARVVRMRQYLDSLKPT